MVYGLYKSNNCDVFCIGYYTTSEEAEKAAVILNREHGWENTYWVRPLECLDGKYETYKNNIVYEYSVTWSVPCGKRAVVEYESYRAPHIDYRTWPNDEEHGNREGVHEFRQEPIRCITNPLWSDTLECIWYTNKYLTDDEALKIAKGMVKDWRERGI